MALVLRAKCVIVGEGITLVECVSGHFTDG